MRRRRLGLSFVALGLAATVAVGCSDDGGGEGEEAASEQGPAADVTFVEEPTGTLTSVEARRASHITVAGVLVVDAAERVHVQVTATGDGHVVEVPRTARALVRHRIPVVGLRAETTYELAVTAVDGAGAETGRAVVEMTTGALPPWIPEIEVHQTDPARMEPGVTLFDIQRWGVTPPEGEPSGMLVALDEEGEVVWYHRGDLGAGDARMTADGTIFLLQAPFGFVELDILGNPVERWVWGGPDDAQPGGPVVVDSPQYDLVNFHHEVAPEPDGTILAFSRYQLDLTEAEQEAICPGDPVDFGIREDLIMEFTREGEVIDEWSLSDIIDPAQVPGRELCAVDFEDHRDWAHGNGFFLDRPGNRIVVTARHIDLLFAFRYRDDASGPSGELLWSLGPDGTLPLEGEPSYGLHAPELEPDGTIMLFDNGNDRPNAPEPYSRAVRYAIDTSSPDPAQWSARQVWEFRTTDHVTGGPLYADFLGDADLQPNGNVLISAGGINQTEPPARGRMLEVVPHEGSGGDIVFDVSLPDTYVSYRAERLPSLYAGERWVLG